MSPALPKPVFAALTDIGMVREENQDSYGIHNGSEEIPDKGILLVVADGMGGEAGGATASRTAVETVLEHYANSAEVNPAEVLVEAFVSAATAIHDHTVQDPGLMGMGTTCTALSVLGDRACVVHVGDTRAYRIRGGEIHQLTEDQTLVQEMVNNGHITDAEARVHPQRNVLTQALGGPVPPVAAVSSEALVEPGDTYLLCSDGLCGLVRDEELKDHVTGTESLEDACSCLVELAKSRGGHDNITVLLLHYPSG